MDGSEFRFRQGDKVRLRDNVDPTFYDGFSTLGNEGWIVQRRRDKRFNLPEVYIKWDRNHWSYNGAPDRWTFEDHFDLVEETMPDRPSKQDLINEAAAQFAAQLAALVGPDPDPDPEPEEPSGTVDRSRLLDAQHALREIDDSDEDGELQRTLQLATEKLRDCEGFIMVGVEREPHPKSSQGVLVPFAIGFSQSADAELLVQANMAKVAANSHQDLVLHVIAAAHSKPDA